MGDELGSWQRGEGKATSSETMQGEKAYFGFYVSRRKREATVPY
jgi:hypothetical protein